jgi:spermidine synthase
VIPPLLRRAGLVAALSGGATLAAEVLGARLLRTLLGSAGLALSGTLAGTLGGLGLGAWLAARALRHRRTSPRALLTRACGLLWLYATLAPTLSALLATPSARALVSLSEASPALGDLARILLGVALTAAPGALAGAVYPATVALSEGEEAQATAFTGALSSLGAAVFALVAVFIAAPALGVAHTLRASALAWPLAALLVRQKRAESLAPQEDPSPVGLPADRAGIAALALAGFASTGFNLALTRLAELSFGPSAYALAAATAAHVTALAAGELLAFGWTRRRPVTGEADARRRWSLALAAGALAAVGVLPAAMSLPRWTGGFLAGGVRDVTPLWIGAVLGVSALALPVIGAVGVSMAFAARALGRRGGEGNGRMLGAMAGGNVLGALLTASWVMPAVRIEGALVVSAGCLALGWSLVSEKPLGHKGIGVVGVVLGAALLARRVDPAGVLDGPFLYAGSSVLDLGEVVWRRDGREATVAVRRAPAGAVLLQINGKVDATSDGDAATQTVVALLPVAFARDPRDVLVVGLGSGMTADAARSIEGVRTVRVLELVPEVITAARRDFRDANRAVLEDPRVTVRTQDAAHALRGMSETWDVIVSEPSNPWVAGMSDLFTREAFEAARARLRPGGTFGAWFHAYSTDAATVAAIVRTFSEVFPRCTLVEVGAGVDYLLLGGREPWTIDLDVALQRLRAPVPRAMLTRAGIDSDSALLARFLAGPRGVRAVGAGGEILRATDLRLEFDAPRRLYRDARAEVFARFARVQDLPLAGLVRDEGAGSTWLRLVERSEPAREAAMHLRRMAIAEDAHDYPAALAAGELAVGLRPGDSDARTRLARLYLHRALQRHRGRDPGGAEADLTTVVELRPYVAERFRALVLLGDLALRRRDHRRALARVDEALGLAAAAGELAPELYVRRAEALAGLNAPQAAAEALDEAIRRTADPARRRALESLRHGR